MGTRVVGFLPAGAWAETVAVPTNALAQLPDNVTFAQAATLPVAGLTALYSLEQHGAIIGRRMLVTGASGGVGHLAVELANHAGATVVASVGGPNAKNMREPPVPTRLSSVKTRRWRQSSVPTILFSNRWAAIRSERR